MWSLGRNIQQVPPKHILVSYMTDNSVQHRHHNNSYALEQVENIYVSTSQLDYYRK